MEKTLEKVNDLLNAKVGKISWYLIFIIVLCFVVIYKFFIWKIKNKSIILNIINLLKAKLILIL